MTSTYNPDSEKDLWTIIRRTTIITANQTVAALLRSAILIFEKTLDDNSESALYTVKAHVQEALDLLTPDPPATLEKEGPLSTVIRQLKDCPDLYLQQPILDEIYALLKHPKVKMFILNGGSLIYQKYFNAYVRNHHDQRQTIDRIHQLHQYLSKEVHT